LILFLFVRLCSAEMQVIVHVLGDRLSDAVLCTHTPERRCES